MGSSHVLLDINETERIPLNPATEYLSVIKLEDLLLDAVLNNRSEDIEEIVRNASDNVLKYRYKEYNNKTPIILACTEAVVNEETVRKLYSSMKSRYGNDDLFRETNQFGWEPIHYLAQIANPTKLEAVLGLMDRVNALTYFSENALHVLLQYGSTRSTIDIEIYNNGNSNSSDHRWFTIIDREKENITECAKLLISRGVDVNQANIWNETPICLAIGNVYPKVIRNLLEVNNINLDINIGAITVEEYLRRNDLLSGSVVSVQESPVSKLFTYLKSGNEDWFLQYNDGNIKDYVNDIEGEDGCGGTMMHMCLMKGFFDYLKNECYSKELPKVNIRDSPMLRIFNSSRLKRCIIHLLDNGADISKTTKTFKTPILEYAAIRGYYPFVAVLLQHQKSKICYEEIFTTLSKLFSNKMKLTNHKHYERCVLYLLLNKLLAMKYNEPSEEISDRDSQLSNHKFTRKKIRILNKILCNLNLELNDNDANDSEIICQLLRLGASLTSLMRPKLEASSTEKADSNHSLRLGASSTEESESWQPNVDASKDDSKLIVEIIHPNILMSHINDCIRNNVFNYNSIIQDENNVYSETRTIGLLTKAEQKNEILVHPFFIYYLHEKWSRISWVYYLDLCFHFVFLISIYVYMITIGECIASLFITCMYHLFYVLLAVHVLKELVQLLFLFYWKYFLDIANAFELALIISCIVTICLNNIYSRVVSVIVATFIFFIMWGQLPNFTKYTIIFGSLKYFFQYVAFYFVQFISFAVCFYILFPFEVKQGNTSSSMKTTEQILGDLSKNLFYTIIYFTGEFSERILEPEEHHFFGRLITTLFIFCMTIILNNLLVAFIVADMDEIQKSGKLYKQVKMANFIQRSNTFIKRIHDFKSLNCFKKIIGYINIFKKDHNKVLVINDINTTSFFDDDDIKVLKDIRNQYAFDVNVLKDVYDLIMR